MLAPDIEFVSEVLPAAPSDVEIDRPAREVWLRSHLDLLERIHTNDAAFVAPLKPWLGRQLRPSNPFFREAELVLFRALRGTRVVGTISALRDHKHERVRGERAAFFGFFACEDDLGVARALIDAAEQQARVWGASVLRGPRNLSRVEEVGATIQGFNQRAPMLAGHHPRYIRELLEELGFAKHHDVMAFARDMFEPDASGVLVATPLPAELARRAANVNIAGLEIRPFSWLHARRDLDACHELCVEAFRDVPENTPMTRAQFRSIIAGAIFLSHRQMLQLAHVDGNVVGFALCFPDLQEAIACAAGRVNLRGIWGLLRGLRSIRTASSKLLGVLPAYRSSGLSSALIARSIEGVRAAGYERLEASLVDERNAPSRRTAESAGLEVYKRYRIYDRALA